MARLRRTLVRLVPATAVPAGIGHNNGPPLDVSWGAWVWRKAATRAWKTPPRDLALRRLRRAEQLGLGYRELTGVLIDRGTWLGAVVFAPGALGHQDPARPLPAPVRARFGQLENVRVLVCLDACAVREAGADQGQARDRLDAQLDGKVGAVRQVACARCTRRCGAPPLAPTIAAWLAASGTAPAGAFLVGPGEAALGAAEDASLGLYKRAEDYFAPAPL